METPSRFFSYNATVSRKLQSHQSTK